LDVSNLIYYNIPDVIKDERWAGIFRHVEKSGRILDLEAKAGQALADRDQAERQMKVIPTVKKERLGRILELTTAAFDEGDDGAKEQMRACQKEVDDLNALLADSEARAERFGEEAKRLNALIIEATAKLVNKRVRSFERSMRKMNASIGRLERKLAAGQSERDALKAKYNAVYAFFHAFFGKEIIDKND